MSVRERGRRILAAATCLVVVGVACVPIVGCPKKSIKSEQDMPAKAKAKAEQMRKEGMPAKVGGKQGQ